MPSKSNQSLIDSNHEKNGFIDKFSANQDSKLYGIQNRSSLSNPGEASGILNKFMKS
jgi:hypothetical protein